MLREVALRDHTRPI